jgi:hypothetical protein
VLNIANACAAQGASHPAVIQVQLKPRPHGRTAVMLDGVELAIGHAAVCAAARHLIECGCNPAVRMEAWRDQTLALCGRLGSFAAVTVEDGPNGTPRFRFYRPVPVGGAAEDCAIPERRVRAA